MAKLIGYQIEDRETRHIDGVLSFEVIPEDMLSKVLALLSDSARHSIVIIPIYEDTIEEYDMIDAPNYEVDLAKIINDWCK